MQREDRARFEAAVLPHLDAAFNLARWLLRERADAEDATQEALVKALQAFGTFRPANARAWLLEIVRNSCYDRLRRQSLTAAAESFDELTMSHVTQNPETLAMQSFDRAHLTAALEALPASFREVIVLRELEGCSYKEIAEITSRPIGTVMSALARARQQLRALLLQSQGREGRS